MYDKAGPVLNELGKVLAGLFQMTSAAWIMECSQLIIVLFLIYLKIQIWKVPHRLSIPSQVKVSKDNSGELDMLELREALFSLSAA